MQLTNLIKNLKLGKEAREEIDRVLALPEVEAILSREEQKTIAHRRELSEKLAAVPGRHKKSIEEAVRRAEEASRRVEKIEEELVNAKALRHLAVALEASAQRAEAIEAADLRAELQAGRDRRLDDLFLILDKLDDQARSLFQVWPAHRKGTFGGREVIYHNNLGEIEAARNVLAEGKRKLEGIAMGVMSRQEITEAMAQICADLDRPLAELDLLCPFIGEQGEVKSPQAKTGTDLIGSRIERAAA